jgi:cell division protein FtsB
MPPAATVPARRSTRNPSRIRWDKLGRVALVLVLLAILASYVNPIVDFFDAWSDSRAERQQLSQLQEQNRELRARAAALAGPNAAELEARRQGMAAAGELPYVIK